MKMYAFIILVLINVGVLITGLVNVVRLIITICKKGNVGKVRGALGKNGIILGVAVLLLVVFALFTHFTADTPKIVDADGNEIQGSIAELEQIEVNGHKEWISIRGKNKDNPVLLFLAGGPGGTQLAATRYEISGLEDKFVVVNWEQPGSGKSYNCMKRSTITIDTYIEDGRKVTEYLCKRFNKKKIYLVGES